MSDKPDDDISIDFSGIKKWFNRQKGKEKGSGQHEARADKHAEKRSKENEEEKEDSIELDLSGIKNIFRRKDDEKQDKDKHVKEKEDEVTLDFSSMAGLFGKHKSWMLLLLLILIPLITSVVVRMHAQDLSQLDASAQNNIYSLIQRDIENAISQQYPNLPAQNRQALVSAEMNKAFGQKTYVFKTGQYAGQGMDIQQQIEQNAAYIKSFFQDEQGRNYIPDIDPYFWMRYARNYLTKGHVGDVVLNGQEWDNHQLAPIGRFADTSFHNYYLAWQFRILDLFMDIRLEESSALMPVIISAISIIPAFFIGKRIAGNVGGFFAAFALAVNAGFLGRTFWGHADTDGWIVFFALMVTWLFIEAFEANSRARRIVYGSLAGFFTGIFARTWLGWWYIFDFILGASGIFIVYYSAIHFRDFKKGIIAFFRENKVMAHMVFVLVVYIAAAGFFVTLFSQASFGDNLKSFVMAPLSPLNIVTLKDPVRSDLWPNVFTTVAELNEGNLNQIISQMGGRTLFYISLLGIALTILKKDKNGKPDIRYALLLAIWYLASIYASFKGIRFTLLLAPAFSVAFGVAFGMAYIYLTAILSRELKIARWIVALVFITAFSLFLIGPTQYAYAAAGSDLPIINDAWWNSLNAIKNNSTENAIISSWWDFGHHFKYIADRPVTFDGTTQELQPAHWIGKTLLTDDEDISIGILRMLDCGSSRAFETLYNYSDGDQQARTHKSVKALYSIFKLDKDEAKMELTKEGYTSAEAEHALRYTHCEPPQAFMIASEDMIGKSGVWGHFGSWNFERADIYFNVRNMPKEEAIAYMTERFNYSRSRAEQTYFEAISVNDPRQGDLWVAPRPGYVSGVGSCSISRTMATCANNIQNQPVQFVVNLTDYDAYLMNVPGKQKPNSIAYADKNGFHHKMLNGTLGVSVSLIKDGNSYANVWSTPEHAASMFNRMFYFDGEGLRHYRPFYSASGPLSGKISVWRVEWNGGEANRAERFREKTAVQQGDTATVNYILTENGTVIDSSIANWRGVNISSQTSFDAVQTQPFSFVAGNKEVIPGFDEGVIGMKIGEEKIITVPPEKGYTGNHPLAGKTLIFKVRVEAIR
ncbi:FKBP-type peptidyl-prolyl cis-trans isomerase [Candidatus Woesearchaeota archaeon]|nr:FKBP-type peptidyl-prolyl cis-trans isomerase [Candidatus Woesearchaeota archaeon]